MWRRLERGIAVWPAALLISAVLELEHLQLAIMEANQLKRISPQDKSTFYAAHKAICQEKMR
jgi:hypothetical protein